MLKDFSVIYGFVFLAPVYLSANYVHGKIYYGRAIILYLSDILCLFFSSGARYPFAFNVSQSREASDVIVHATPVLARTFSYTLVPFVPCNNNCVKCINK